MHFSDEQIQRWLHDELDASTRDALTRHLTGCSQCARTLEEADREEKAIFDLLQHVDHATPVVDVDSLVAPSPRGALAMWGRRAAIVVATAALAGAAYAFPGSPLPAWLSQAAGWITGRTAPVEDSPPSGVPVTSGISVPMNERFSIQFTTAQAQSSVMVAVIDGPNVVVRVNGGTATFTTETDRLTIENARSTADYEIDVPRNAPWVEIHVGSQRVMLKDGDQFVTDAPIDSVGRYVLPLASPISSGD
jgi:hypothetical protein